MNLRTPLVIASVAVLGLAACAPGTQTVAGGPKATTGAGKAAGTAGPGESIVAKGDTLGGIAKKVGISLKSIQEL